MKKFFILLVICFCFPGIILAANDLSFDQDVTVEINTYDLGDAVTIEVLLGSEVSEMVLEENYIDLSLDSGSRITFQNDGDTYFAAEKISGFGENFPACSEEQFTISSRNTAVVRLFVLSERPYCPPSSGSAAKAVFTNNSTTSTDQSRFVDMPGHWAEEYVDALYELEVIEGRSDNEFEPDSTITRAEAVKVVLRLFGFELGSSEENPFADLDSEAWYYDYVLTGYKNGIVSGYGNSEFRPGADITRAEALKVLFGAFGAGLDDVDFEFTDTKNHWARDFVANAADLGVVSGYEDGSFRPDAKVTRAEFAKMALKLYQLTK